VTLPYLAGRPAWRPHREAERPIWRLNPIIVANLPAAQNDEPSKHRSQTHYWEGA
jgi:hypothetical protein